jgi:SAM-dependent methyltransferase
MIAIRKNKITRQTQRPKYEPVYCVFCEQDHLEVNYAPTGHSVKELAHLDIIGAGRRQTAVCPLCGSLDRERSAWCYIANLFKDIRSDKARVLHVAPELRIRDKLSHLDGYTTFDIDPSLNTDVIGDLTQLEFEDNYFDVIICNHVLEHIVDDRTAVKELNRVLRAFGRIFLTFPIARNLEVTREANAPLGRTGKLRAFGQADHVRLYGRDWKERLFSDTTLDVWTYSHPKELCKRWGLIEDEPLIAGYKYTTIKSD